MALVDEILAWTEKSLPPWQRDAARRLFQFRKGLFPTCMTPRCNTVCRQLFST